MPIWIPLLMAVLGTAIQTRQNKKAAERQRAELRIGRDKEKDVEGTQRTEVLEEADKFDPTVRQEALDAKAAEAEAAINAVLADNETSTTGDVGVLSDKLLSQRAASERNRANNASILAALMGKVQAPGDAATEEELRKLDLIAESQGRSGKLKRIGRTTQTLAGLEGMKDPKAAMLGSALQTMGMSLASGNIMKGLNAPVDPGAYQGNMSLDPGYKQIDFTSGIK